MALLTFSVYVGSSIYSAGITGPNPDSVTMQFNVSVTTGLVGLTVFVLGYGVGPMFWAPLSEFPNVGRLPVCRWFPVFATLSQLSRIARRCRHPLCLCGAAIPNDICQSKASLFFFRECIY